MITVNGRPVTVIPEAQVDSYVCPAPCGNDASYHGFYPCDENGADAEPVPGWTGLYKCAGCGALSAVDNMIPAGATP